MLIRREFTVRSAAATPRLVRSATSQLAHSIRTSNRSVLWTIAVRFFDENPPRSGFPAPDAE